MEFLAFEFELTEPAGPLDEDHDRLRNVVADVRIFVGGQVCYRDVHFPIAALAVALRGWRESVADTGEGFAFTGDAAGTLMRLVPGNEGWYFTSVQMELPSDSVFSLADLLVQVAEILADVEERVQAAYGFSVRGLEDAPGIP